MHGTAGNAANRCSSRDSTGGNTAAYRGHTSGRTDNRGSPNHRRPTGDGSATTGHTGKRRHSRRTNVRRLRARAIASGAPATG
jgi:hypothetical protein